MCSKGQLQKGDGVIRMGYTVFPFAVRVYATLKGLFLISSIAATISFSSGIVAQSDGKDECADFFYKKKNTGTTFP